jgi:hypothetical protein
MQEISARIGRVTGRRNRGGHAAVRKTRLDSVFKALGEKASGETCEAMKGLVKRRRIHQQMANTRVPGTRPLSKMPTTAESADRWR